MSETDDIEAKVRDWLEEQGYPLEMRAATAFRAAGLRVRQSEHYLDVETDKSREIDLVCFVDDDTGVLSVRFVVECKSGTKKPWVVFSSSETLAGFNHLIAYGILSPAMTNALVHELSQLPGCLNWFSKKGRVGYAATHAFSGGTDVAFGAAMSTVKACLWQHGEHAHYYRPPLLATFPVIVVDARIFECYLDDAGQVILSEVSESDLFFGALVGDLKGVCIHLVSEAALPKFCQAAAAEAANLRSVLQPTIDKELHASLKKLG